MNRIRENLTCANVMAALALVCLMTMVAATSTYGAQRSEGKQKILLTAVTQKDVSHEGSGERIVLALQEKHETVGKVTFPACEGTGSSVVCGGTVNLEQVGSGLTTIVTFGCPPVPPFTCEDGKGLLGTKGGKSVGSIILKVTPSEIHKGKRFPVVVFVNK